MTVEIVPTPVKVPQSPDPDVHVREHVDVVRDFPAPDVEIPMGVVTRPARTRVALTAHHQDLGQDWTLSGGHVDTVRGKPYPEGEHETLDIYPRRPSFRAPTGPWWAGAPEA